MVVERLALDGEDGAVGLQQVLALHALAARTGTHQQGIVGVLEGNVWIVGDDDAGQQREGTVFQLHDHALDGCHGGSDVQQLQDDGLVLAQHVPVGDAEQQGVGDLAGGAGDGNTFRSFHDGNVPSEVGKGDR